jgi:outer membrane protein TolC
VPGDRILDRSRCRTAARLVPVVALLLVVAAGCTRRFFRERADRDVENLLTEKNVDPRWALENWYIYPDERARFVDTEKPDHPRKPPDDPAAAALAPNPQPIRSRFRRGIDQEGAGYLEFLEHCDQHNRSVRAQMAAAMPPDAPAARLGDPTKQSGVVGPAPPETTASQQSIDAVLRTDEQPFLLTLDQALELSLFNSRDFQDRREDLYLAALPVTLQRFNFVTQLFLNAEANRTFTPVGPVSAGGAVTGSAGVAASAEVNQLFPTGAALVARFANRLVSDIGAGSGPTTSLSTLTLELTQPLLRGGGWAVTLEPLTQAERNLLYGIRSYARYRELFYVYIAGGGEQFNAPYSLIGLNLRGVGPSLNAPSQGYLPTLLSAAQERNERENIRNLYGYLELFREYQGKGDFSELQVGQVEQQLLRGQSSLLQRRQELQNGLDSFKLQLGVPTRLPLELDDGPVKPVRDSLAEFTKARDEFNALRPQAEAYKAQPGATLREGIEKLMFESPYAKRAKAFQAAVPARWARWKGMTDAGIKAELRMLADQLRALQVRQARQEAAGGKLPEADAARLDFLPKDIALGQLEQSLRAYTAAGQKKAVPTREGEVLFEDAVNAFIRVMSEARDERRDLVREAWPKLPSVVIDGVDFLTDDLDRAQTVAAQQALGNRLELMNTRAQLNDSWRNIAVRANSLLGVLNVGYNYATTSTPNADQPFNLGGSRGTHNLVVTGELPIVRRAERNEYRVALIAYQRNRRGLQATEDFILNDLRVDLRNLRVLAENYRIQKRAVEVAYDQVENALDVLQAPPVPDQGGAGQVGRVAAQSQQQAANAASLTNQLLNAQNSLLAAQNGLYTIWVNYLVARMTLYRDLERLPLDPRGVWIDEPGLSPPRPEVLPGPRPVGDPEGPRFAEGR